MRLLILGDLTNIHIQKLCQWLAERDIDIFPIDTKDPTVIKSKIAMFNPLTVYAFGKDYKEAIRNTEVKIGLTIKTADIAPKCVNTSKFRSGYSPFRRIFQETPDTKIVLVPGTVTENGNYGTILQALAIIIKSYPDVNVVFHNPGEDLGYQEKMIDLTNKLGLDGHTFSNGAVQYVRMPQIYNAADVVVNIPALEVQSAVILEAMACEKPIIAAKNVGNSELLPNNWLIDVKDEKALAETIEGFLRDDFVKDTLPLGRKLIQAKYEQDNIMKTFLTNPSPLEVL